MPEITIRAATTPEDVATVRNLMQAYGDHLTTHPSGAASICLEGYARELERLPEGYATLLIATVDGKPAGCVALRSLKRENRSCEMKRLWVSQGFRGLGLGQRLLAEAIAWAEQAGYIAIYLDTVPAAMPEANRLYKNVGFLPAERYNQSNIPDLVFFCKSLVTKT
ncbi:N-acetyltransferase [Edaphobacter acidisoli]|uniref:N-acetyltransferase n=1 Tax=Edaphobacter acidisoli TaxID=2040573 RepID=A0A916RWX9_9BACT|nr:GNAT family N-acetyltransferase [Edaphobacter acidisoli]GGA74744.1 N-acetyltransferase [Edaphobacter acidisoli]